VRVIGSVLNLRAGVGLEAERQPLQHTSAFVWFTRSPASARRTLLAASLGWMLDSFDVMLYSLVLPALMEGLRLTKSEAGVLGSVTLLAAAAGGLAFGVIGDRWGRTVALRWSIVIYAVFTAACGTAQSMAQLLVFRVLLGFGMGGEWASGATLVSETWPACDRGKALGLMQSSWAVGYAFAAFTAAIVMPIGGWRSVFFVGVLPAFLTIWIRRNVKEPEAWQRIQHRRGHVLSGFAELFCGRLAKLTTAITLMNACALFAWWGFNLWVPAYLSLPRAQGGAGLSSHTMTMLVVVMQVGMWLGYITFGIASDIWGRKRSYIVYLTAATGALMAYSISRSITILLLLGPVVAFFGTGHFTGLGTVTAEIYENRIRATAQGFTYNVGRIASAAAPFTVGSWAQMHGFGAAFQLAALSFAVAAALWIFIPETKPKLYVEDIHIS
jgi:MFS family permease